MGTINGFTFAPDLEAGVFDTFAKDKLLPKKLNVAFSFTVLHNHLLGWQNASGEDPVQPREWGFPYLETLADNSEGAKDAPFESVVSQIQTTEVPIDVRAEAIKKDLLNDTTAGYNASLSPQQNNINRRIALSRKNNSMYAANVTKSGAIKKPGASPRAGLSALGGGGGTFFNK